MNLKNLYKFCTDILSTIFEVFFYSDEEDNELRDV